MMASNLPPGLSVGDIPGNRPGDEVFERWMDGRIGELIADLAADSLPDMTDCPTCGTKVECRVCHRRIKREGPGPIPPHTFPSGTGSCPGSDVECARCDGSGLVPWPFFDVEAEVIKALEATGDRVTDRGNLDGVTIADGPRFLYRRLKRDPIGSAGWLTYAVWWKYPNGEQWIGDVAGKGTEWQVCDANQEPSGPTYARRDEAARRLLDLYRLPTKGNDE